MPLRDVVYVGHMLDMARKSVGKTVGLSREHATLPVVQMNAVSTASTVRDLRRMAPTVVRSRSASLAQ